MTLLADTSPIFDLWDSVMMAELAFRSEGACRGMDPKMFYPERGHHLDAKRAKEVCMTCGVRAACLAYALAHHERDGVWGGTSEKQRRVLLRAMGAAQDLAPVVERVTQGPIRGACRCAQCRPALHAKRAQMLAAA